MSFWVDGIDNEHVLSTKTPDGRDLVFISGTAYFALRGTGANWVRDDANAFIGPRWRRLDDVAPMAALASWLNLGTAVNAGAAVDNCRWARATQDSRILLEVAVAVSDSDGLLYRFAYTATAIGILVAQSRPDVVHP